KRKQFTQPPKKQKARAAEPQTADGFQQAADFEEETGGKWRVGDPAKSGRAFIRALEIYDKGLDRFPQSFDLAYNKARLMLEITQQQALVDKIGLPLVDLLKSTLDAHRVAQSLNGANPDVLFNTSQVLTSLAEQLSEAGDDGNAVPLLQEALELLSACLSKQELLLEQLEQQRRDFEDAQEGDGGVALNSGSPSAGPPASGSTGDDSSDSGEYALIEAPVSASDLLDTVQASLSALTTLVSLTQPSNLPMLGAMAQQLCDERAPTYLGVLESSERDAAAFSIGLARANFVAANADAQYNAFELELEAYAGRLSESFSLPGKDRNFDALLAESQARAELVLSALDRATTDQSAALDICWTQATLAQNILSAASKLDSSEAKEGAATLFERKGSIELLRYRLATTSGANEAWQRSASTLLLNSQTYFAGGFKHAQVLGEEEVAQTAKMRWFVATMIQKVLHGG
ncbi:hypothetical protein K431DRAFT_194853, partial [Polychaeton citri CBS 116435]